MTALAYDASTHTDVVCPPFAGAFCRHCGDDLQSHQPADPDNAPTPGDAACVADLGAAFWDKRPAHQFELADGESLDCPDAGIDPVCDVTLCSEHTTVFTACVANSSVLHHGDCRHTCPDCADAACDDARARS